MAKRSTSAMSNTQNKSDNQESKSKNYKFAVFNASRKPNKKNELNWFEVKEYKKAPSLEDLQRIVGGNLESPPYRHNYTGKKFTIYVNEEGLMQQDQLGRNDLAGGALYELGVPTEINYCVYWGNVVVLGENDNDGNETSLTDDDIKILERAIQKYRQGDDSSEENEDEKKLMDTDIKGLYQEIQKYRQGDNNPEEDDDDEE